MNGKRFQAALKHGYRSGLEMKISDYLKELDIPVVYEAIKIEWEDLMYRTYTPDFVLPNGIIIESKGRFTAADRRKHIEIKKQHPKLDIRFVFYNSRNKLSLRLLILHTLQGKNTTNRFALKWPSLDCALDELSTSVGC